MLSRDYTDIIGGGLLIVTGLGFSAYAYANYDLGSIIRMGPGMFPTFLGVVLAVFGVLQAVPAFFRTGTRPDIRFWSPLFVLGSIAVFALLVRPFGLIPAIVALILVSSAAELRVRPVATAILTVVMCVTSWLIFRVGLGVPLAMFRWPF